MRTHLLVMDFYGIADFIDALELHRRQIYWANRVSRWTGQFHFYNLK